MNKDSMYKYAIERNDYKRIEKLIALNNPKTFWSDVSKLTKNVKSCHGINRWQILAENYFKNYLTNT